MQSSELGGDVELPPPALEAEVAEQALQEHDLSGALANDRPERAVPLVHQRRHGEHVGVERVHVKISTHLSPAWPPFRLTAARST